MGRLRTLATASTIATFILISIGGLVRATKSGLGCGTDWPDCSGKVIPVFSNYTVAVEFSHRLAAALVTVLIAALAFTAIRSHRDKPKILWSAVGAFLLVLFQAGLGAVVVMLELDADTVVLHLGTAMTLLALLVHLTYRIRATMGGPVTPNRAVSRSALAMAIGVLLLLLVGSYLSGTGGTGGFRDWPLMDGRLVPDLAQQAQAVHFFHRALAALIGVMVAVLGLRVIRSKSEVPEAARLTHIALGLFAVEVLIGAINVWTRLNAAAVTAHLAVGAAIWATLVATAASTSPALALAAEEAHARPARGAPPLLETSRP
ncbi:MAG TPA: COX15/CtaA family protein [Actinomycetota bacterium]|nr:COX15/CtaA family protein [Actinomycetota bacterium]